MRSSQSNVRRIILSRLRAYLAEHYAETSTETLLSSEDLSLHQIDAILAFKSDPYLDELRSALDRMEEGTFGLCLSCKHRIGFQALRQDPTRRLCERCDQQYRHPAVERSFVSTSV
jgi:RNA polymerase-binding transcription factor DksA